MALRIPWDEYETALLIEACLKVDCGEVPRTQAVAELSKALRKRAIDKGIEIDEIYRNENGISMQMSKIQQIIHHKSESKWYISKLFLDMVEMYYSDRQQFDEILLEAKANGGQTPREIGPPEYGVQMPTETGIEENDKEIGQMDDGEFKVDFTKKENYSFTKPITMTYFGRHYEVNSWSKVYATVCRLLFEDYPELFRELGANRGNMRKVVYNAQERNRLVAPAEIAEGYYVEVNQNAPSLIDNIRLLLDYCVVDYGNLEIIYRKRSAGNTNHHTRKQHQRRDVTASRAARQVEYEDTRHAGFATPSNRSNKAVNLDSDLAERLSVLLRDNFENGYRPDSKIDKARVKQDYEDACGEKLLLDDDEISSAISQVGIFQDGRIYYRGDVSQSTLLKEIQQEIVMTFQKGATCIYTSCIYERYQHALAEELRVYSEDVLRERLASTCNDSYVIGNRYLHVRRRKPDVDKDVRDAMANSQTPLNYEQLSEILWYIPLDLIKHSLVTNDGIVNVARETYFYADNLPVSAKELDQIAELLKGRLGQKPFVTGDELREMIQSYCPSVAINTEEYTTWGLRNVLAYRLRDRFSTSGSLICEKGTDLTIAQVYEMFCETSEKITLDELLTFKDEIGCPINWDSVYNKMLRISTTEFVRRDLVRFDVLGTDERLDRLIDGDYMPIKDFTLYLQLPSITPINWNNYVLEGYAAKESKEFTLIHACYTQEGCCGAIVRRSSRIRDFKGLLIDVLANNRDWRNQKEALGLLVEQGYLQRKKYSEIDLVIQEARRLQ